MLLIIDNYDSFTYNLYQCIASSYANVKVMRNDAIAVSDIPALKPAGIILSPGPGRPESAGICVELIQNYLLNKLPVVPLLGVCLGHQAITLAAGGEVIHAKEISHGKADLIHHTARGLYYGLPQPFNAGRYHSLIANLETLPSSLIIEAENSKKMVMGIRHQSLPIYGVQFHPESILTPEGNILLKNFIKQCVN